MAEVKITGAQVFSASGKHVATIEHILVGGGTAGRWDEARENIVKVTDPVTEHFHVRLLSQTGPMFPDELVTVDTFDEAVAVAEVYATKAEEHAALLTAAREAMA